MGERLEEEKKMNAPLIYCFREVGEEEEEKKR